VVFDLDGVVIESRHTYRRAYCDAVNARVGEVVVRVEDVHALKRLPQYNAPRDCVRALLLRAGLPAQDADVASALADARERYAGEDLVERVYGHAPRGIGGAGLWRQDRLLIPTDLPPLSIPVGVFTGRDEGEARWVTERFRVFEPLQERHFWHTGKGVAKPDPACFDRCVRGLGVDPVLYIGDLAADADTVARYRALGQGPRVLFALVGNEGPAGDDVADLRVESATDMLRGLT